MFEDRKDAGQKLAKALSRYAQQEAIVLAIPRGGVEVGYQVAKHLKLDFSIIVVRKLPFPYNPEAGFGAIAEDGSSFISEETQRALPEEAIAKVIEEQKQEIARRVAVLRNGKPLPKIAHREVILVDDGIAVGSTIRAAIMLCRNQNVKKIVVAVPVTGRRVANAIAMLVDDLIVLETPSFFQAVAQVYQNWYDVSDQEVLEMILG